MHESTSPPRQQRTPYPGFIYAREATAAVREVREHLTDWQCRAAKLRGAHSLHRIDPADLRDEAQELIALLIAERVELEARLQYLTPMAANHAVINAVQRAIERLQEDLEQLIQA